MEIAGLVLALSGAYVLVSAMTTRSPGPDSAVCASTLIFDGVEYSEVPVLIQPIPGERLGMAVIPACREGDGPPDPDIEVEVARVPNVEAATAVVVVDEPSSIFIRNGIDRLPSELAFYFETPPCSDAPVSLQGPWLGIRGPDGETELDMIPPYDVNMLVELSTDPLYERASLTIRVPRSLGEPLSRKDLRTSLWEGGDIRVTATCNGDAFQAEAIDALAPEEGG